MLIADKPASPIVFPTKKPSTIAYTPDNAKDKIEGITYEKKTFLSFIIYAPFNSL